MSRSMLYGLFSWLILCSSVSVRADDAENKAVESVEKLMGRVFRDTNLPGKPVFGVSLSGTKVTDAGLKELAGLKSLTELDLDRTKVTDAGLRELAGLKNLTKLYLQRTKVTGAGLKELAGLKNLTLLYLHGVKVTNKSMEELRLALPKCQIFQ